ncbi:glycosyltransferase family 4 protein [Acetobacter sp.]|uniref:glycosyltransferase family 4 protein n=1 Tax=Acetobacter sp. TaxID=440 RepID=UPI0025C27B76|nr:glycosyltransferase family 1 protein [Acetobacter sp.]MCH4091491.1 glycosyltransferase family 4 protein [Acetobacter sp.]MCI1299469.1 glycosyltransferase family 4 protein [Acetobacter sp.]MCI1316941.1 glycosyltransferase family 4 protein [Acetobacter sp.]
MLWIDITDLLDYLGQHSRPSGIQRVVSELARTLVECAPERTRFVRRFAGPYDFETVSWRDMEVLFAEASERTVSRQVVQAAPFSPAGTGPFIPPQGLFALIREAVNMQASVFRHLNRLGENLTGRFRRAFRQSSLHSQNSLPHSASGLLLSEQARPGDVFLVPGSPWNFADYARTVRWLRDSRRMTFGLLIHDMIPVFNPEWCDRGVIANFTIWHRTVLPLADHVFTTSAATARDVQKYARQERMSLLSEPAPIGIGAPLPRSAPASDRPTRLPPPDSYVLFVSTLEARKNHIQMVRVWRRLMEERGAAHVPTLVFAGRVGWLVQDLMQQLDGMNWLDGKIRHIASPTDRELASLYDGCLFTVFPSLAEGWGLPVSESLASGKPCLASGTTAIPEAGGSFARYFDPDNAGDIFRIISETLDDPQALVAWKDRIRRTYRPPQWQDCAHRILERTGCSQP